MDAWPVRTPDAVDDTSYARPGERMWVLLNHIHADKREQFETFMRDVLEPAAKQLEPNTARHVRLLSPTEQNEDGSYTYIFLMDPVIEGADYDISNLLRKHYDQDQAQIYLQQFQACFAAPQVGYEVTQSS